MANGPKDGDGRRTHDETTKSYPIDRRTVLRTTGVGVAGLAGLPEAALAQSTSPGDELWSVQTDANVRSSPTVVDETVFVGSGDGFPSGGISALAASDGSEKWTFQTDEGVESSPTVVDETVFIGESRNGTAYALDAGDGSTKWQAQPSESFRSSPTVADGTVFVGGYAEVYALDASDGSKNWRFQTGGIVHIASPTVVDGTVFVGGGHPTVYALDASDGSEQWRFETGGDCQSSPTVADGTVFIGSNDNNVYALDASNGSKKWTFQTNNLVQSSPTVVDGTVFVGSYDATVYALDASDGSEQWRFETGDAIESSPTVVGGTVFVGSNDSNVYALDASDGSEQWRFETGGAVRSSPTVVDGTVFVGSNDSNVYALEAGVSGASEGSRVNLGTLGHHHEWADGQTIGDDAPATTTWELTADASSEVARPGETGRISPTLTNTGDATAQASLYFESTTSETDHNADIFGDRFDVDSHDDAGGEWLSEGWRWDENTDSGPVAPGNSREPSVEITVADDVSAGEYMFSLTGPASGDNTPRATATIEVQTGFDPTVHGFGFENWAGFDTLSFSQIASRSSDLIANEVAPTLPDLTSAPGFDIGFTLLLEQGMEGWANGHCLGMVTTARQYFNDDVPSLAEYEQTVETAVDIEVTDSSATLEDVAALDTIETDIDSAQSDQLFDSDYVLRYIAATIGADGDDTSVDEDAVLREINEQLAAGNYPELILTDTLLSGHSVLAYDISGELDEDTAVSVKVYDPNYRGDAHAPDAPIRTLPFFSDPNSDGYYFGQYESTTNTFDDTVYVSSEVDPNYDLFEGAVDGFVSALRNGLDDYLAIGVTDIGQAAAESSDLSQAASPSALDVSVTTPDGQTLQPVDVPSTELEAAFGYQQAFVEFDTTASDYTVEVTADAATTYEIEMKGSQADGDTIDTGTTKSIAAGETQQFTPGSDDDDGGEEPSALSRFDTNENGEIDFIEVIEAISAHNSGTPVGGDTVGFGEVLKVIAAHNAGTEV